MGNKGSKGGPALSKAQLDKHRGSGFSETEVAALFAVFASLHEAGPADDALSLAEFQGALGFRGHNTSLFLERAFKLMDGDNDGRLSFAEFLGGVACFQPNASEKKVRFSFRIYAGAAEFITRADLRILLAAVLKENGIVALTATQLDDLVARTFQLYDLDGDDRISYDEYKQMCAINPSVLKHLTINVAELVNGSGSAAGAAAAAAK